MSRGEFIFSTSRGKTGLMVSGHMEKGEGGGWGGGGIYQSMGFAIE